MCSQKKKQIETYYENTSLKQTASQLEISLLRKFLTCMIEVIRKQMGEYIDGRLANLPQSNALQTLSAPAHNMFAEKVL